MSKDMLEISLGCFFKQQNLTPCGNMHNIFYQINISSCFCIFFLHNSSYKTQIITHILLVMFHQHIDTMSAAPLRFGIMAQTHRMA